MARASWSNRGQGDLRLQDPGWEGKGPPGQTKLAGARYRVESRSWAIEFTVKAWALQAGL